MPEDFRLKVFVTLAQERSFTRTAAALSVSQPAVSQNISELEKQFGTRLFDRHKGEIVLTPAGRMFEAYAHRILSEYQEVSQLFTRFPDTTVRVSASDEVFGYFMSEVIREFAEIHREVNFELSFLDDEADLRITLSPVKEKRGMLALSYHPSPSFASTRLYRVLSEILQPTLK